MWLPFRRRREHGDRAEARRARQIQRALDEETANEVLEANYERVDQAEPAAFLVRSGIGLRNFFGGGTRPSARQQLKEEGYDGD